jgi:hypothetical protein
MRTKTLLLTAALSAAGIASSMAQVYSVNAVGYINVTVPAGKYAIIANQLTNSPGNYLTNVLSTGVPDSASLAKWDAATGLFLDVDTYYDGYGWRDSSFNPSSTQFNPGEAAFFQNPSGVPITLTFVGEVPQGDTLSVSVLSGYNLISSIVPMSTSLTNATMGFPVPPDQTAYLEWDANAGAYKEVLTYYTGYGWKDGSFNDANPTPAVGGGFFMQNPDLGSFQWTRSFKVN